MRRWSTKTVAITHRCSWLQLGFNRYRCWSGVVICPGPALIPWTEKTPEHTHGSTSVHVPLATTQSRRRRWRWPRNRSDPSICPFLCFTAQIILKEQIITTDHWHWLFCCCCPEAMSPKIGTYTRGSFMDHKTTEYWSPLTRNCPRHLFWVSSGEDSSYYTRSRLNGGDRWTAEQTKEEGGRRRYLKAHTFRRAFIWVINRFRCYYLLEMTR